MIRYFTTILIIAFWIGSCETVVQLDVPRDEKKLVVNSFFHPDSTFGVSLSRSQFILDESESKPVSGASVTLMDGQGNKLADIHEQETGIYTSNIKPKPGKLYQVEVSKSGYTTVNAKDKVPEDSAKMVKYEVTRNPASNRSVRISVWIADSDDKDYYQLYGKEKVTLYGEEIDTTTFEQELYIGSSDPVFNDQNITGRRLFFDDVLFNGKTYKMNLATSVGSTQCPPQSDFCDQETEVTLYIEQISEAYFNYIETLNLQGDLDENPFAEPVPVFSNIENGLGIFGGYRISEYPIEIPEHQADP